MIFRRFFHHSRQNKMARVLYGQVVFQARRPTFYTKFGVADTVDGRFDMIVLHAFLLLRRLGSERRSADLAQALFDVMFEDMDYNLREMSVGDIHIKGKIIDMLMAFYGRIAAYDAALAELDDLPLAEALRRNVYRGTASPPDSLDSLVTYVREVAYRLYIQSIYDIMAGRISFGLPHLGATAGSGIHA